MRPKAFRLLCFLFFVAVCSTSALAQSNAEGATKPADDKGSPIVKETESNWSCGRRTGRGENA